MKYRSKYTGVASAMTLNNRADGHAVDLQRQ
jgi:hypothetical protein